MMKTFALQTFFLFATVIFLSGCFTMMALDKTHKEDTDDKITKINNTYIDDNKNLIVNFSGKLDEEFFEHDYHLIVNLDSISKMIPDSSFYYIYLDNDFIEKSNIKDISVQNDYLTRTDYLSVVLTRNAIQYGWKTNINQEYKIDNRLIKIDDNYSRGYTSHIAVDYFLQEPIITDTTTIYTLSIVCEPEQRVRYWRYIIVPPAFVADLITLPFQVIALIYFIHKL